MSENKKLILFDFDGTLTGKDSLLEFISFSKGKLQLYLGFLMNVFNLLKYFTGRLPNWAFKEKILSYFFKGDSIELFNKQAERFALEIIPKILRPQALTTIEKYKNNGDNRIIIVSASCSNWIKAWADMLGLELIATELEVKNNILTGKLGTRNCYGDEKVSRLKSYLDLSEFQTIIAYGDSHGDKEMLEIAHIKYFRSL